MEKEGLGLLGSFRYFLKGWATPVEVFEDTPVLNDVYICNSQGDRLGAEQSVRYFFFSIQRYTALLRKSLHEIVTGLVCCDKEDALVKARWA